MTSSARVCAVSSNTVPAAYEKSVFINCPFDDDFQPLFHAIVLTVAAQGFTPRCAHETEGQADPRIVRIARGLMESKYSIHDLSRYQGQGAENLGRFNMPLELGIALGMRYLKEGTPAGHNWVALVPEQFMHQKFISDLAGFDPPDHDQKPPTVIRKVAAWLSMQPDFTQPTPTAKTILDAYPSFCALLADAKAASLGTLTWPSIIKSVQVVVSGMPLV
jgi:hypothetical protein